MSIALRQAPRQSLVDHIEAQLRDALISGRLQPGQRLNTRALAAQLGTSLTPVREALIRLAATGALAAAPAQAFQVPMRSRGEYREICQIRRAVEGLAAEQAAARFEPQDIPALVEIAAAFRDAKRRGEVAEALAHNKRFRFTLYAAAAMPQLLELIELLWLRTGPCFNYLYPQPETAFATHHNYDDVIAALGRRDGPAVRAAIERAIEEGAEILMPHLDPGEAPAPRPVG